MDLFKLFASIFLDTSDYDQGVKDATKTGESFASKLGKGLVSLGRIAGKGLAAVGTAATGAVTGLLALESSTEDYRIAQGKLSSAFEAAGYSTDVATGAYSKFYGILGDTDTATEASQLLAKLSLNAEDMSTWIDAAAGVWGTFGDALPIEGLIESANETARVGQVTGSLADALNWASISEDDFNALLAGCSTEAERNRLIMDTLSTTYQGASDAFYENNQVLIDSRNAQQQMMDSLSHLGTSISGIKSAVLLDFLPGVSAVVDGLSGVLAGADGAQEQFSAAIGGLITTAAQKLPEFMNFGVQILSALISGITENIPILANALPGIIESIAVALAELAPELAPAAVQIMAALAEGLTVAIPTLIEALPSVITGFLTAIVEAAPQLIQAGATMLQELAVGITQWLPTFVAQIPVIITNFIDVLTQNMPLVIEAGVQVLMALINGLIQAIPQLVSALPQIIQSITSFVVENLPVIVDAGIQLLLSIIQGILDAIPDLIAALPEVIGAFVDFITQSLPVIIEAGIDLLFALIQGIIDAIPDLIAALPEIIKTFVSVLTENLPKIIEMGIDVLFALIDGIIDALPDLIAALPEIITTIITVLIENLPLIIEAGVEILIALITGIIESIPELVAKIPQIVQALVNGFKSLGSKILQIGKDIVQSIWNGIKQAWDGLVSWFNGIWNSLFGNRDVNVKVNKSSSSSVNGSHAGGLAYVPYDGYIAELHKGERVLTADEARDSKRYNGGITVVQNIYSEAKTAADLMQEARWQQNKAVMGLV